MKERYVTSIIYSSAFCVLCVLILIAVLYTKSSAPAGSMGLTTNSDSNDYQAATLMSYKSNYIGNNGNVGNLLGNLPYAGYLKGGMSLQTDKTPFGVTVNYDFSNASIDSEQVETTLRHNATVIFALIDNVDIINITADLGTHNLKFIYTRTKLQQSYPRDMRDYAKSQSELQILLNSFHLKIRVYPQKYALTMSSTPGIRLLADDEGASGSSGQGQYIAGTGSITYAASSGQLLDWNSTSGKITEKGTKAEFPLGTPAYWSPLERDGQFGTDEQSEIPITITVCQDGATVAEKQVRIHFDGSTAFFTVAPSDDVIITESLELPPTSPNTIAAAVSQAIKDQGKSYLAGEAATEGHIILGTEKKDDEIKVYTIASFGWFGFENGIFTTVSGSGAIPTVITFAKNENGTYALLQYQEPQDGEGYTDSVKKMFPQKLWLKVLSGETNYPELVKQKEEQAAAYLESIGREAKVSDAYVDKKRVDINVEASNKIFAELTKYHSFLNSCPYWIGSKEIIENGVRYIYVTSQSKTNDGYDLVIFQKKKEDDSIVIESKYKIVGNEPQLVE